MDAVFRCAFYFLFRENEQVYAVTQDQYKRLQNRSAAPMIAIGIRVGDDSFYPEKDKLVQLKDYIDYFDCAEKLIKSLPASLLPKDAKLNPYYVMSESLHLRQLIKQQFGHKVIIDNHTLYFHGNCGHHRNDGCDQEHLRNAIIEAAGQLIMFAGCDMQVYSQGSGFPALAKPPQMSFHPSEQCTFQQRGDFSF
jgi:hypothetical protein